MRGRSGDAQVSAGWGLSALASGGSLHGDSLGSSRHVLWLNAQYTTGSSFDLVGSVEVRNVFRGDARTIPGFALRRKGTLADFHAGVRYDTSDHVLHPLLVVDARWLTGLGSIIWIDTNPASPDPASRREVRLGLTLKGFTAADPVRS
jgi:hypothetical protein